MQQNICSPAKDIKAFTFTDNKACGVTKNAKSQTKRMPKHLWKQHVCEYLMKKLFRIPSLRKTNFGQ